MGFKILKEDPEVPGVDFWCDNQKLTLYPAPAPKPGIVSAIWGALAEVFSMQNTNSSCDLGWSFGGLFDAKHKWWLRSWVFLWRSFRCKTRIVSAIWGVLLEIFPMQNTNSICDLGCSFGHLASTPCTHFALASTPCKKLLRKWGGGPFLEHFLCSWHKNKTH